MSHGSEKRAWVFTGPKASGKRADRLILGVEGFEPGPDERYGGRLRAGMSGSVEACYMLLRAVCDGIPHPVGFSLNWEPLTWGAPGLALELDVRPGLSHGRRRTWIVLVPAGVGAFGGRPPACPAGSECEIGRTARSTWLHSWRAGRHAITSAATPAKPGEERCRFVVPSSHALPGFVTDSARIILRRPGWRTGLVPVGAGSAMRAASGLASPTAWRAVC